MQILNNFSDLGKAFGVPPRKQKDHPFTCRKCGKVMRNIPETNVFLCECGHRVFTQKPAT